jgi:hypothetical protein
MQLGKSLGAAVSFAMFVGASLCWAGSLPPPTAGRATLDGSVRNGGASVEAIDGVSVVTWFRPSGAPGDLGHWEALKPTLPAGVWVHHADKTHYELSPESHALVIHLHGSNGVFLYDGRCTLSFVPLEGHSYEIRHKLEGSVFRALVKDQGTKSMVAECQQSEF